MKAPAERRGLFMRMFFEIGPLQYYMMIADLDVSFLDADVEKL